jgi:hypothetical protein
MVSTMLFHELFQNPSCTEFMEMESVMDDFIGIIMTNWFVTLSSVALLCQEQCAGLFTVPCSDWCELLFVSFMPWLLYPWGKSHQCPLVRRLDVPQSWSGHSGEEKNYQPLPGIKVPNPDCSAHSQLLLLTELPLLCLYILFIKQLNVFRNTWHVSVDLKINLEIVVKVLTRWFIIPLLILAFISQMSLVCGKLFLSYTTASVCVCPPPPPISCA